MNKIFFLLAIMILAAGQPAASQNEPKENFLLKRFESDVAFDYLQEFSTSFLLYVDKMNSRGKTKIAVRFCSTRPMQSAVTKGAIDLSAIYNVFGGYGFIGMDMIVLRSDECVSKVDLPSPTELWVINNVNELPPFNEKRYSDDITSLRLGNSSLRFAGDRNYIRNAKSLASELAEKDTAFGVIHIFYKRSNITVAKSFKKKIVDVFTRAGIDQSRYSVEIIRWNNRLSAEPLGRRTIFPDFHLVTIKAVR